MYLNVRHKPLRARLLVNPLSLFTHRESSDDDTPSRSPSPERRRKRGTSVPIPPIPPTSNPRGELIFSSRVDRGFREAYERYRAAFERKRNQREAAYEAAQARWGWHWRAWPWNWARPVSLAPGTASAAGTYASGHSPSRSVSGTPRGRGSDSESTTTTPNASRRSSPVPESPGRSKGTMEGRGEIRNRRTMTPTPPNGLPRRLTPERERTESFSFLLANDQSFG